MTEKVDRVFREILKNDDATKRVRIKAGIYYLTDRYAEVGLACDHARLACNSIKNRYDINYCVYDEMLREKLRKQQYVVDHIDEAIEREFIKVYYQPVIRVKTGQICGYEALVRWVDPGMGVLSPADFIETLEQFHLIHKVDCFVVEKVCQEYIKLKAEGEPIVPVSVNLSRLDFELCDIYQEIENSRAKYKVPVEYLDLEVTESALNENNEHLKEECKRFREEGYKLWLDDFGSGYSSLNVLTEFEFDVLKMDLVFLRNFDHNEKTRVLMTYIANGARKLGLEPLTEGVETEEHYEFLKSIDCERAQGFFFGKPEEMDTTRALTRSKGFIWETTDL